MMLEAVMAIFGLGFLAGMLVAAHRQVQLEQKWERERFERDHVLLYDREMES